MGALPQALVVRLDKNSCLHTAESFLGKILSTWHLRQWQWHKQNKHNVSLNVKLRVSDLVCKTVSSETVSGSTFLFTYSLE